MLILHLFSLSGGNIERDHLNFINLSNRNNTNASLIKILIKNSKKHKIQFLNLLREKLKITLRY